MLAAVLDAGAEEIIDQGAGFEIITEPSDLVAARTALQDAGHRLRLRRRRIRARTSWSRSTSSTPARCSS